MRFWQANGESVKTSIRVKTVMKQLTEEGIYHGGVTPFGYRTVDTGRKNKKGRPVHDIEIDPKESMYVKMIFDKAVNDGYLLKSVSFVRSANSICTLSKSVCEMIAGCVSST